MLRWIWLLLIVLACTILPTDAIPTIVTIDHHAVAMVMSVALPAAVELLDPLDRPIYGAKAIAAVAGLVDENGEPNERAAFHALEAGYLDASKFGKRRWWSTPRRILNSLQTTAPK